MSKITKIIPLAVLSLGAYAGAAFADEAPAASDGPAYYGSVGVQANKSKQSHSKLNDINARIGTRINPYFGVEGELGLGLNSDNNALGKFRLKDREGVYAVGFLPVSDRVELLGRVGVANQNLDKPAGLTHIETGASTDVGVGAQVKLNSDYALRGDLTHSYYSHKAASDRVGVSLVHKF
jgi:hypothetical protein